MYVLYQNYSQNKLNLSLNVLKLKYDKGYLKPGIQYLLSTHLGINKRV